uniref:Cell division protein n=1 Tax=Haemonchus placei TaxID=6290 RepID=A0A158QK46_HAEPC
LLIPFHSFDRMEIPDSDDFFNEAIATASTDAVKKAVKPAEKVRTQPSEA